MSMIINASGDISMSTCAPCCAHCNRNLQKQCAVEPTFGLCLGCHGARYCSPACQNDAWFETLTGQPPAFPPNLERNSKSPTISLSRGHAAIASQGGPQEGMQSGPKRARVDRTVNRRRLRALPGVARTPAVHGLSPHGVLQSCVPKRCLVRV